MPVSTLGTAPIPSTICKWNWRYSLDEYTYLVCIHNYPSQLLMHKTPLIPLLYVYLEFTHACILSMKRILKHTHMQLYKCTLAYNITMQEEYFALKAYY